MKTAQRYKTLLLAVDFHVDNAEVIDVGSDLATMHGASLHLAHVNEPLAMAYATTGINWSEQVFTLEASMRAESRERMTSLAQQLNVSELNCHLLEGSPASEIHKLCAQISADLIVMGTHGQSGLRLLLGSTANSVLHGAGCDVLAVRVKDS